MFSFIFNDLNSKDEKLYIEGIPSFPSFTDDDNIYSMNFAYKNTNEGLRKYTRLKNKLKGTGILRTSLSDDTFLRVEEVIFKELEKNKTYTVNQVSFIVEPYIYVNSGEDIITITTKPYNIYKADVTTSKPRLKIYGLGIGNVSINNKTLYLNMSENSIIVDSYLEEAFSNSGFMNNCILSGSEWLTLEAGDNVITYSGGITKIELIPNWRY